MLTRQQKSSNYKMKSYVHLKVCKGETGATAKQKKYKRILEQDSKPPGIVVAATEQEKYSIYNKKHIIKKRAREG